MISAAVQAPAVRAPFRQNAHREFFTIFRHLDDKSGHEVGQSVVQILQVGGDFKDRKLPPSVTGKDEEKRRSCRRGCERCLFS